MLTSKIIGLGGFPHSEIVGSKLAHSSPTLIAACHVLHRLYAPRHPRIALTSHLRVHTTNDNTGSVLRLTRNSAEQCSAVSWCGCSFLSLVWKRPILAVNQMELVASDLFRRSLPGRPEDQPENQRRHGIDLKNPFTMSKSSQSVTAILLRRADLVTSSFGYGEQHSQKEVVEPIGIEPMT